MALGNLCKSVAWPHLQGVRIHLLRTVELDNPSSQEEEGLWGCGTTTNLCACTLSLQLVTWEGVGDISRGKALLDKGMSERTLSEL